MPQGLRACHASSRGVTSWGRKAISGGIPGLPFVLLMYVLYNIPIGTGKNILIESLIYVIQTTILPA